MDTLTNEETLSIIVPAYDEAQVIGRLLGQLVPSADEGGLDILVVANGCTDNTAEVAASFGPPVRVLSISAASKREAANRLQAQLRCVGERGNARTWTDRYQAATPAPPARPYPGTTRKTPPPARRTQHCPVKPGNTLRKLRMKEAQ